MVARSRVAGPSGPRPSGRHLLRSAVVADELVRDARVGPADHVVEIGAGTGRLTGPLADRAGLVTAIELDPILVEGLRRRFARRSNVRIVRADATRVPPPSEPWRAFGNVPFALTTSILRRLLDDVDGSLRRADLLVQLEAARKRAAVPARTLLSLGWQPWWELSLTRRIPRRGFEPMPSVDAGLLVVRRREPPLLDADRRRPYLALLARAFDRSSVPVRRSLRVSPLSWKRFARERGIDVDARPSDLDVWDWVAIVGEQLES